MEPLKYRIAVDPNTGDVILDFNQPVHSIRAPAEGAREMGRKLVKTARSAQRIAKAAREAAKSIERKNAKTSND